MTTVQNLSSVQSISAGDQLIVFITDQNTTFKVSVNVLLNFITSNFPSDTFETAIGNLTRQTDPTLVPVSSGQGYISLSGFVVVAP